MNRAMHRAAATTLARHSHRGRLWRRARCRRCPPTGFTLVEILIVAVILGILASVVVPSLGSASSPIPRPIADLLELDMRRARIESIGAVRETNLVIGKSRDSWWLQSVGKPDPTRALPSSMRQFGSGNLAPFAGHALEVKFDGAPAPDEEAVIAIFDENGTKSGVTVEIVLRPSTRETPAGNDKDTSVLARWRIDPQRTTVTDVSTTTR